MNFLRDFCFIIILVITFSSCKDECNDVDCSLEVFQPFCFVYDDIYTDGSCIIDSIGEYVQDSIIVVINNDTIDDFMPPVEALENGGLYFYSNDLIRYCYENHPDSFLLFLLNDWHTISDVQYTTVKGECCETEHIRNLKFNGNNREIRESIEYKNDVIHLKPYY